MGERYREGHEYVVCDECNSHILIDLETRRRMFDPDDEHEATAWVGFTCDNDECEADCSALVCNPYAERRPTVLTMDGETTLTGDDDTGRCPATRTIDDGHGPAETVQCSGRDGHGWQHRFAGESWLSDDEPNCLAPTPRAKP